jgi:hypothetical protein
MMRVRALSNVRRAGLVLAGLLGGIVLSAGCGSGETAPVPAAPSATRSVVESTAQTAPQAAASPSPVAEVR